MPNSPFNDPELEKWVHSDEKFIPTRYFAEKGSKIPTIGYGFRLEPANRAVADRALGKTTAEQLFSNPKFTMAEPQARKLTSEYLRSVTMPAVESYLGRPYTQIPKPIYRSVANMAYNLGPTGLQKFKGLGVELRKYLDMRKNNDPSRYNALARAGQEIIYSNAYNNMQYKGLASRYADIRNRLLSAEPVVAARSPKAPAPTTNWKANYMKWVANNKPLTWVQPSSI